MRNIQYGMIIFFLLFITNGNAQTNIREKYSMDRNWKFHFGNASDPSKDFGFGIERTFLKAGESHGAINPDFDDNQWRTLDIPHDWVVEQNFVHVKDELVLAHGYKPVGGLFPETSIGWYRKSFFVNSKDSASHFEIHFDGVFRNYLVFLNGHFLGNNLSGYTESSFDITDYLNFHQKNELVVRVDATQSEGWFYEGAGIYRHVWLEKMNPTHIAEYGTAIMTDSIKNDKAFIHLQNTLQKETKKPIDYSIHYFIYDKSGLMVFNKKIDLKTSKTIDETETNIIISNPKLWSVENPYLYTLITQIEIGRQIVDSVATKFGIRTIVIDKDKGVLLNGKHIKIKGVNCHQDHAGIGTALPDAMQYYRIRLLKEMGANAYRSSHHPPTKELLNACDELGMLVLVETRITGTSKEYLDEFEKMILRDRNHPSVFLWSIGNEEGWIQTTSVGKRLAQTLIQKQLELDPSRTCTYAADLGNIHTGINEVIPVRGFNYRIPFVDDYHRDHPSQPIVGTETGSTVCTRGIYVKDTINGYVPDHDITYPWWASSAEQWWKPNADKDWFIGGFVWTGFDYRGEPTPFEWPNINSHFGIMDVCGFPKNNYYYYKSWWSNQDVIQISPHWNWKDVDSIDVWCNSNADEVELKLNGKSLGKKTMEKNGHLQWMVKYFPGKLEAIGYKSDRKLYTKIETTGAPTKIILTPDRTIIHADGEDICVVNISVQDQDGKEVLDAMNLIQFSIEGNGKIIGVGNGDPSSHEPDKCSENQWQRKLFNGKCQIIIQSKTIEGNINLKAISKDLIPANLSISVRGKNDKKYVDEK